MIKAIKNPGDCDYEEGLNEYSANGKIKTISNNSNNIKGIDKDNNYICSIEYDESNSLKKILYDTNSEMNLAIDKFAANGNSVDFKKGKENIGTYQYDEGTNRVNSIQSNGAAETKFTYTKNGGIKEVTHSAEPEKSPLDIKYNLKTAF